MMMLLMMLIFLAIRPTYQTIAFHVDLSWSPSSFSRSMMMMMMMRMTKVILIDYSVLRQSGVHVALTPLVTREWGSMKRYPKSS